MKKLHLILIAVVAVLLAGVVMLAVVLFNNNEFIKNITLSPDGTTSEKLEFSANGMGPGGKPREYTINLKSKLSDRYIVTLEFEETEEGTLKNFVNVTLQFGDEEPTTYLLAELLDGQTVTFECNINSGATFSIKVTYAIPSEVGNEAQGATADFDIILTAERF